MVWRVAISTPDTSSGVSRIGPRKTDDLTPDAVVVAALKHVRVLVLPRPDTISGTGCGEKRSRCGWDEAQRYTDHASGIACNQTSGARFSAIHRCSTATFPEAGHRTNYINITARTIAIRSAPPPARVASTHHNCVPQGALCCTAGATLPGTLSARAVDLFSRGSRPSRRGFFAVLGWYRQGITRVIEQVIAVPKIDYRSTNSREPFTARG